MTVFRGSPEVGVSSHQALSIIRLIIIIGLVFVAKGIGQCLIVIVMLWIVV